MPAGAVVVVSLETEPRAAQPESCCHRPGERLGRRKLLAAGPTRSLAPTGHSDRGLDKAIRARPGGSPQSSRTTAEDPLQWPSATWHHNTITALGPKDQVLLNFGILCLGFVRQGIASRPGWRVFWDRARFTGCADRKSVV